jgi:hypothetical protein
MKNKVGTIHHIIPLSRGGRSNKNNFADVNAKEHDLYHQLFGNKTPLEILEYLVYHFWLSQDGNNGERFLRRFESFIKFKNTPNF